MTGHFSLCGEGLCIGYDGGDAVSERVQADGSSSAAAGSKRSSSTSPTTRTSMSSATSRRRWPVTDPVQRSILPIPDRPVRRATILYDAKDPEAKFPPIRPLRPPAGAPNVLIVLLDDVGFGASSAFGGPCHTPTAERLAAGGLKYTRFHTTAICSPTRAALISGRNHHSVGMGGITEMATSAPGYNSMRPNTCSPLPEILKLNGYATAHVGKCHEVPVWETSPVGPFDRWPSPGQRVRVLLRLPRRRDRPVVPDAARGDHARGAVGHAGGGLPPHRGPDRQGDRLGPPAEGARAGQAVLHVLRARRHPRPAPRAQGVGGQVQGPVRRRLGRAARADVRAPEGARRDPARRRADRSATT